MLRQRLITATLLLGVLLGAVFHPVPEVFSVVTISIVSAAAWEWAKLNQYASLTALALGGCCALVCGVVLFVGVESFPLKLIWVGAGGAWVVLGFGLLRSGLHVWAGLPRLVRLVVGVLALWVAWLGITKARMMGVNFLFSILVLVWIADVFAYFSGRALGGRFFSQKLAPIVSPGKTWEGVCGGVAGVVLCAFAWVQLDQLYAVESAQSSIYTRLHNINSFYMVVAVVFLASMSVVGDLLESLFKRSAGVKDSSGLLPGHGGVLDRIDALLPILPLSMMLST